MNVLFCSEGFIVDGVASFNLYLSIALRAAGYRVAIAGRWAGPRGFQQRHRRGGVTVIQCLSPTVVHPKLLRAAIRFVPDIIVTDARRSMPLARKVQAQTGAALITVFHDPPQNDQTGVRGIAAIKKYSAAWVTAERSIYTQLQSLQPPCPVQLIQRPITGVVQITPLPPQDPFRILCLGRLSKWKAPGFRAIVDRADQLKAKIPSLTIDIVGGGRRCLNFWAAAQKANLRCRTQFIHIVGARNDPQPWIQKANLVCAGATSAVEGILSNRPVLAFSGFWLGLVTEDNLAAGIDSHFGERAGEFYVRDNPDVIVAAIDTIYHKWRHASMTHHVERVRRRLTPHYDADAVCAQFNQLFQKIVKHA